MNAAPSNIPERILLDFPETPELLLPQTNRMLLEDLDFPQKAVLYLPGEHYLGWAPAAAIESSALGGPYVDPLAFLFSTEDVEIHSTSTWIYGEDSDDPAAESRVFAGYYVDHEWADEAVGWTDKLHALCCKLVDGSSWYRRSFWTGQRGDLPPKFDGGPLYAPHLTQSDARTAAEGAKRMILSSLAFLTWYLSVAEHEANFFHLAQNEVPIHYRWTQEEEADGRFRRLSPAYWTEYRALLELADNDADDVRVEDLPSYLLWKSDLERYDWFFQDLHAGKRGKDLMARQYKPQWEYRVVDFRLWGARTITHWGTIRAYSEKFRGTTASTPYGTVCTFFRQNPRGPQEPAMLRERPSHHANELTDFAATEVGPNDDEEDSYWESTVRVREMAKNKWAPRPGRSYNSFDGRLEGPERVLALRKKRRLPRSEADPSEPSSSYGEAAVPGGPSEPSDASSARAMVSQWARSMASDSERRAKMAKRSVIGISTGSSSVSGGESPGGRASSPRNRAFVAEFDDVSREEGELANEDSEAGPSVPYQEDVDIAGPWTERASPRESPGRDTISDRATALERIALWAPKVTESVPHIQEYEGLFWDLAWLSVAVLVCDDGRSLLRMKAYAACNPAVESITDVLELAICFGLPFEIYVPASRVRDLARGKRIEILDQDTLEALYAPGYRDTLLTYGSGGVALYEQYRGALNALLHRPHAIAFIYAGGVLQFVAEQYNRSLVRRLVEGPSLQVTEHMAGRTRLLRRGADEEFFVTDRVSNSEISLLLGHVSGTKASNEAWLWPPPEVMESESLHMRGYLSDGAYKILANLRDDIFVKKKFLWRTRADWKEYFRVGQKRLFTPAVVPATVDFEEGSQLFERTFPANWMETCIADIAIPEVFEGLARD
ncbi:hypothetical protein B0H15DRAFT_794874 [Mycena belliarum]|uniref:Uncharacterized protein n=1 Tax=Mycena belliarum TaxID=1033014 RepID=A0AAD6Y216_9AGAR|nr:hypothetical protein B0H15DRAFT_794874 [Mycena belliae]